MNETAVEIPPVNPFRAIIFSGERFKCRSRKIVRIHFFEYSLISYSIKFSIIVLYTASTISCRTPYFFARPLTFLITSSTLSGALTSSPLFLNLAACFTKRFLCQFHRCFLELPLCFCILFSLYPCSC